MNLRAERRRPARSPFGLRAWGAIVCLAWCLVAGGVIASRVAAGRAFDTDIQSLLPQTAFEPVIRAAIKSAGDVGARRVAVLVTADGPEAAADLERTLTETGLFLPDRADGEALGRWLFANRNALLCETPARFDGAATARRGEALLYAPTTPLSGELLVRDPFLLTLQLAECLSPPTSGAAGGGVLVSGRLKQSPFRIDVQDKVAAAFDAWSKAHPEAKAARTGAVFHAHAGAARARSEISFIAAASMLGVLLALVTCFRRPQAVLGTLAVTTAGALGSLAAALLVFEQVHVMVFVFGSALIGVTSDYALHYLATGPQTGWASPETRVRLVWRPLAACALSTALGFASLAAFGVSIFNQVAVFSVAGIATAWLFTVTVLPSLDRSAKHAAVHQRWWARLEAPFAKIRWTRLHTIVGASLAALLVAAAVWRGQLLDDVRRFQPRSEALAAEESQVRAAVGFSASPVFLLSYGASPERARAAEEGALATLPEAAARDVLATSRFDPSPERRAAHEALLRERLYAPYLEGHAASLGLAAEPFATAPAGRPALLADLESTARGVSFLVAPLGPNAAAAMPAEGEGFRVIDPAARYSSVFAGFRGLAAWAVLAAFAVGGIIVVTLYRTLRALFVLTAPAAGCLLGLAVPAAFGAPLSFFSIAALFVVIGAGIDHSVFRFESRETNGDGKELVVFLAALTTILSMGLLGFSGTYPVQTFGIVVAVGVTAAYVFSFIPAGNTGRAKRADD